MITPWMVVPISVLFSLYYLCTWIGKPLPDPAVTLLWPHPFKPWESVMLYSLYGVPTAYVVMLFVGIPCYLLARKAGILSIKLALCVGVMACIPAALVYSYGTIHVFWPILLFLLLYGLSLALTFAWLMRERKQSPSVPVESEHAEQ